MKRRIFLTYSLITFFIIGAGWTALTFYVEQTGPEKSWEIAHAGDRNVLILFDPDPFYNLDEQVCRSFGKGIAQNGFTVDMMTIAAAKSVDETQYDVVVFCANTYNWRPDWAITNYIEDHKGMADQAVIAITLGAGSTEDSQHYLEEVIKASGRQISASHALWLWRPNDEEKMKERNVDVAVAMAFEWGNEIGGQMD